MLYPSRETPYEDDDGIREESRGHRDLQSLLAPLRCGRTRCGERRSKQDTTVSQDVWTPFEDRVVLSCCSVARSSRDDDAITSGDARDEDLHVVNAKLDVAKASVDDGKVSLDVVSVFVDVVETFVDVVSAFRDVVSVLPIRVSFFADVVSECEDACWHHRSDVHAFEDVVTS